jgi:hypothetical protein
MDEGWVRLWRKILDNPMWEEEVFTRGQAWVDLLLVANHKQGSFRCRGLRVIVGRGQVGWSQGKLAGRWGWSRGKVARFLKELVDEGMIEQQTDNISSLVTIVNYEDYQTTDQQKGDRKTGEKQETDTNKNNNNKKNEKKVIEIVDEKPTEEKESKPKIGIKKEDGDLLTPQDVVDRWNLLTEKNGLGKIRGGNQTIKGKIATRMKSFKSLDDWNSLFQNIKKRGSNYATESYFNLAWIAKNDENFEKVVDDFLAWKYDKKKTNSGFNDNIDIKSEIEEWGEDGE